MNGSTDFDTDELIERAAAGNEAASAGGGVAADVPKGPFGDYRILWQIGRGGMGVVYEAEQASLGRRVALKVLPFAAMLDERQLKRFHNEARAAATLDHPNIVSVHSVGIERGVHYYAKQLIEGQSMAEVIDELRRANADDEPIRAATVRERQRRPQPKESRNRGVKESRSRGVKESRSRGVKESRSRGVKESGGRGSRRAAAGGALTGRARLPPSRSGRGAHRSGEAPAEPQAEGRDRQVRAAQPENTMLNAASRESV
jgi:hypothetical protein